MQSHHKLYKLETMKEPPERHHQGQEHHHQTIKKRVVMRWKTPTTIEKRKH